MSQKTSLKDPQDSILLEAQGLVYGDRNASYGHPYDDYSRTAKLWSAILGFEVTAEQAALCMVAVKLSRACHTFKRDNFVDGAGYFTVAQLIHEEQERRDGPHKAK